MAALLARNISNVAILMSHWAIRLIGKQYVARGRGPDTFDCWGLCAFVWKTHFGVEDLPDVAIDPTKPSAVRKRFAKAVEDGDGHQIAAPFEGCAVLMSRSMLPDHCGIFLAADGGGVLHALEGAGVVFTKFSALAANGLHILGFYRPRGMSWRTST